MTRVISLVDNDTWVLLSAGFSEGQTETKSAGQVTTIDWQAASTTRLFMVQSAQFAIADGIRNGQSVEEAANSWRQLTEAVLDGQRNDRRHNKLVLLEDAAANPESLATECSALKIDFLAITPVAINSDIAMLAACAYLAEQDSLVRLNTKLLVSALPITPAVASLPIDEIIAKVQLIEREKQGAQQAARQLETEVKNVQDENELVLLQLQQVQEELEQQYIATQDKDKALSASQQKVTASEQSIATLKQDLQRVESETVTKLETERKDLQEENELLLLQLQQVQEELEQYFLKSKSLENELSSTNLTLNKARAAKAKWVEMKGKFEAELATAAAKITQKNAKLHDFSQKRKREASQYAAKTEELRAELDAVIERAEKEKNASAVALTKSERVRQVEVAALEAKISQQDAKLLEFSQKHQAHLADVAKYEAEIAEYKNQLTQSEHQAESLKLTLEAMRQQDKEHSEILETQITLLRIELKNLVNKTQVPAVKPRRARDYISRVTRLGQGKKRENQIKKARERKQIEFIRLCKWFDAVWYLRQNPDLAKAQVDPAEHYYYFGGFEGRNPGPDFDSQYYIQNNDDVATSGINPLVHYIMFGQKEARLPKPALLTDERQSVQSEPMWAKR